jgi:hypothetical protein
VLHGNPSEIFRPSGGGYLEPRPETCSARLGTNGLRALYSWTGACGARSHCRSVPPLIHSIPDSLT